MSPAQQACPDARAPLLAHVLKEAGRAALAHRREGEVHLKADGSKVTDGDLAAHEIILEGLTRAFPGEAVLSEEGAALPPGTTGPVWYVDPIDGTGAYTEGLAHWGPTVARVVDGQLDVGAFYEPRLDRYWFAAAGGGAWRDGERLAPPEPGPTTPDRTLYLPSFVHHFPVIDWRGKTRALGCTAAHLAQVAGGGGAATVVPQWKLWDVGAGILLVREAGRVVVDLSGAPFDPMVEPGAPFVAAAPTIVQPLVEAFQSALQRALDSQPRT
ncbi:MAG: inositol monophosphatase family protein [Alphaproteobacteria bacterium]|nr:inositol monophosphatase family protein [Alphaproteobacteria bacterium]